jgi:hypothetical protein
MHTKFWLENLTGRDHRRRTRHRWEDHIRIDLKEMGLEGMDWINLVQNRDQWQALAYTIMNIQVP